jgi:hypothetical protein
MICVSCHTKLYFSYLVLLKNIMKVVLKRWRVFVGTHMHDITQTIFISTRLSMSYCYNLHHIRVSHTQIDENYTTT